MGRDRGGAVFGAPVAQPDHAVRAVRAAVRMLQALAEFNREQRERGLPALTIGIGVASGEIVAGNIGGQEQHAYPIIGDAVNLAARLQGLTKEVGRALLISLETHARLGSTRLLAELGAVRIRGKAAPVRVFTLARRAQAG